MAGVALSADSLRRLAFIKFLHSLALRHLELDGVKASPALLMLHDGVEMFLNLSVEHLQGTAPTRTEFDKYFVLIAEKLGQALPRQHALTRMNKARVSLKHHGLQPARADLEAHLVSGSAFFDEATPLIFGLDYAGLSLAEFVEPAGAREALLLAIGHRDAGELKAAAEQIAVASNAVFKAQKAGLGWAPRLPSLPSKLRSAGRESPYVVEAVNYTADLGNSLASSMQMLALGVDLKRYARLMRFMPIIHRDGHGKLSFYWGPQVEVPTPADIEECIQFVVDCAMRDSL